MCAGSLCLVFFFCARVMNEIFEKKKVKMAELTVETASLGSVGVEEAKRDDDDEEETGDHHGDYSCHGNRFYFDTERKQQRVRYFDVSQNNTILSLNLSKLKKKGNLFNPSRQPKEEEEKNNIKHIIEYNHNIVRAPLDWPA